MTSNIVHMYEYDGVVNWALSRTQLTMLGLTQPYAINHFPSSGISDRDTHISSMYEPIRCVFRMCGVCSMCTG